MLHFQEDVCAVRRGSGDTLHHGRQPVQKLLESRNCVTAKGMGVAAGHKEMAEADCPLTLPFRCE